ncbi:MAG: FHA domain-containing protein, partial [Blastocatellia bacterium]
MLKLKIDAPEPVVQSQAPATADAKAEAVKTLPHSTVVLEPNAFDATTEIPTNQPKKATLKILLPTGDVFDRELTNPETQIGKGPRNDIVIADPAVSSAHALIRFEGSNYIVNDNGSRNGTFVNGERIDGPYQLNHGDVVGVGLSKLTFRFADSSETGAIEAGDVAAAAKQAGPPPLTEDSLAHAIASAGLASKGDVDRIRREEKGRRLSRALIDERMVTEEALRDLMSKTFQIPTVDLNAAPIDDAVVAEFPPKLAREHDVFAYSKEADTLALAVVDVTDTGGVEQIRTQVGSVSVRVATATQIREKIDRYYGPRLIGVLPSGEKLEYLIDKHEIEMGKAAHNHIKLTDPTVSNTHAIVITRDSGYSIVDLGSRNGTFINGERLGAQAHTLRHGDKIQLGQTVLTFRNPGETSANVTAVLSGEALEEVRRRAKLADAEASKDAAAEVAEPAKQSSERKPAKSPVPSEIPPVAVVALPDNAAQAQTGADA